MRSWTCLMNSAKSIDRSITVATTSSFLICNLISNANIWSNSNCNTTLYMYIRHIARSLHSEHPTNRAFWHDPSPKISSVIIPLQNVYSYRELVSLWIQHLNELWDCIQEAWEYMIHIRDLRRFQNVGCHGMLFVVFHIMAGIQHSALGSSI